jgi:hypothetical protein
VRRWASLWAAKCLFNVSNGDLQLNPVNGGRQYLRLVRIKDQILVKQTDEPGVVQMEEWGIRCRFRNCLLAHLTSSNSLKAPTMSNFVSGSSLKRCHSVLMKGLVAAGARVEDGEAEGARAED